MKKIFLITALIAIALTSSAQNRTSPLRATIPSAANGNVSGADSVRVNGATAVYLYVKVPLNDRHASFQGNVTRVTAADNGTITLQGSNDGLNYVATSAADTFHVTNAATQTSAITIPPATGVLYNYYRLKGVNTASTDTFTLKAFYFGRQ